MPPMRKAAPLFLAPSWRFYTAKAIPIVRNHPWRSIGSPYT
jgi:hypothetical protein